MKIQDITFQFFVAKFPDDECCGVFAKADFDEDGNYIPPCYCYSDGDNGYNEDETFNISELEISHQTDNEEYAWKLADFESGNYISW